VVSSTRIYFIEHDSILVSSSIPSVTLSLNNRQYLNKKLEELGLWQEKKIFIHNTIKPAFFTVKKLNIQIVNREQEFGKVVLKSNPGIVAYSYGAVVNPQTEVLTITLFVHNAIQTESKRDEQYSGLLLYSLFDVTHVAKDEGEIDDIDRLRENFMKSFFSDIKNDSNKFAFLKIKTK
jgi:hypothetical protein